MNSSIHNVGSGGFGPSSSAISKGAIPVGRESVFPVYRNDNGETVVGARMPSSEVNRYTPLKGISVSMAGADNYANMWKDKAESKAAARGMINAALGTAQSSLNTGIAAQQTMMSNAQGMRGAADTLTGYATSLMGSLGSSVNALNGYANRVAGMANDIHDHGHEVFQQGQNTLGIGNSILALDPNAGGIAGQIVQQYNSYDPNRMVSMAASDVQASFSNAQNQLMRSLSRTGANASSGNYAALLTQLHQSAASALAGAKTRARMQGMDAQTQLLNNLYQQGMNAVKQGTDTMIAGNNLNISATTAKAGMEKSAADITKSAADLRNTYTNSAANMTNSAANIQKAASDTELQGYNARLAAEKQLADMQTAAANFYTQEQQTDLAWFKDAPKVITLSAS